MLTLLGLPLYGQIGGSSTYSFLNLSPSAQTSALAQASIASVEGNVQFAWLNPALLQVSHRNQISLGYVGLPAGINAAEAAYAFGLGERQNLMIGFRYLDYGTFDGTDVAGNPTGTFKASDQLLNGSYSYELDSNWRVGASVKLISSFYETYSSFGFGVDLAAVYQIPERRISIAFVAKNAGSQLSSYAGTMESLPFEMQIAVSNRFAHLPFRWTIQYENIQKWDLTYYDPNAISKDQVTGDVTYDAPNFGDKLLRHFAFSGDLSLGKRLSFQMGYSFRRAGEMSIPTRRSSAGLTFGLGIKLSKFQFNYANRYVHVAGRMHHLGISVNLDDFHS